MRTRGLRVSPYATETPPLRQWQGERGGLGLGHERPSGGRNPKRVIIASGVRLRARVSRENGSREHENNCEMNGG